MLSVTFKTLTHVKQWTSRTVHWEPRRSQWPEMAWWWGPCTGIQWQPKMPTKIPRMCKLILIHTGILMALILIALVISVLGGLKLFIPTDNSNLDSTNEMFKNSPNSRSMNLHVVLIGSVLGGLPLISAAVVMRFLSFDWVKEFKQSWDLSWNLQSQQRWTHCTTAPTAMASTSPPAPSTDECAAYPV